ncbi:unnamed protein product [Adineta ricciae]|uniref:Uncharacterized protein n=1 Tax=Adineta ricciae TaxID=249248 RepID=A0A814EQ96_ADIRI|nr:unnamed protein product [Adineta ricciae]CAF1398028.1 unnamed protein product [Adineta ricciae]
MPTESSNRRNSKLRLNVPRSSTNFNYYDNFSNSRPHRQSTRASFLQLGHDQQQNRYENSYRMQPDDDHKLDINRIKLVAMNTLETAMIGYKYRQKEVKAFAELLADKIRSQMKLLQLYRYKIITQVSVGEKRGEDLRIASQCLWNLQTDGHVTITKETVSAYVTATIFFVYTD